MSYVNYYRLCFGEKQTNSITPFQLLQKETKSEIFSYIRCLEAGYNVLKAD